MRSPIEPILDLYDEKSGSTLKEVSFDLAAAEVEAFNPDSVIDILEKSKATLLHLYMY